MGEDWLRLQSSPYIIEAQGLVVFRTRRGEPGPRRGLRRGK